MTRARVTITLPEELLAAADRRAAEADRSRSRLVAEALRRHLAPAPDPAPGNLPPDAPEDPPEESPVVREPVIAYRAGLGPARTSQLVADMALSPEERVRAAADTAHVGRRRRPLRDRVIGFDRLVDYFEWERREGLDV